LASYGDGFRDRLQQLAVEADGVETELQEVSATKFTCEVYVNGQARASCRIWITSMLGAQGQIGYATGKMLYSEDNRYNEILSIFRDPYALKLEPMGMPMTVSVDDLPNEGISPEQAAEYLWCVFAWNLGT
jgi:hypothetical protein